MFPAALHELPDGVFVTLSLLADFDQCFVVGFANFEQHKSTLSTMQRVLTGTPLESIVHNACEALQRNEFLEQHFTGLAAARAALQGSVFDALQQKVRQALGRSIETAIPIQASAPIPASVQPLLESIRHWLMEMALVGFARLNASQLVAFLPTLEKVQAEPLLIRQAALLTGFWQELIRHIPIVDNRTIPAYRWVDLWTRSLISTLQVNLTDSPQLITGRLELLGIDLRHHANLVSFTAYGLLTTNEPAQLVRSTLSAYKVDTIQKDEIWLLFPQAVTLLDAFAQNQTLHLKDIPLLAAGDLLLPDRDLLLSGNGVVGDKYNLMQRSAEYFAIDTPTMPITCAMQPIDRHPIQLAEPIYLNGYTVKSENERLTLNWGDAAQLPVAMERLNQWSEIDQAAIAKSTQLFGLLRFDAGQWAVQPLAIAGKGKPIFTGQTAAKVLKSPPKNSTVSILQERASRLLRRS
jgi:hypothetical protein